MTTKRSSNLATLCSTYNFPKITMSISILSWFHNNMVLQYELICLLQYCFPKNPFKTLRLWLFSTWSFWFCPRSHLPKLRRAFYYSNHNTYTLFEYDKLYIYEKFPACTIDMNQTHKDTRSDHWPIDRM